jgi:hypothetical protein
MSRWKRRERSAFLPASLVPTLGIAFHSCRIGCCVWLVLCGSVAAAAEAPLHARIDLLVRQAEPGRPAPAASDAEFLRRLSIDLLGSIPSADEARHFLDDRSPGKRTALVLRLLDHPRYAVHMTHVFDVMLLERRNSDVIKQEDWERYLFDSFAANKPYDQLAREILASDGTDPKLRPAVKFYLERNGDPNLLTRDVARIFFGRDFQCCQCHDHPLIDHYHQADYYGLFAFLQRGFVTVDKTKPENKDKPAYFGEKADGLATFQSVFDPKKTKHGTRPRLPGGVELDEPYFPIGAEYQQVAAGAPYPPPKYSRRARLAEETLATANRAFRRNIANRLWALMMGQGLVEPVDLDHPDNPPVNPQLLDLLADDFRAMHYDIKAFLREIALTEAYQRSFDLPPDIAKEARDAHARRLRVEADQKRLAASTAQLDAEIKRDEQALASLRKAADRRGEELTKAETKTAEIKKTADAADEAVAKTQTALADKRAAIKALIEAAAKTRDAAARFPAEKELAEAATKFQARAASIPAEIKQLTATAAQQMEIAKSTARTLEAAQKESCRVAALFTADNVQAAPAARQLQEAVARQHDHLTQLNSLKQAIAAAKSVEDYASHRTAATSAADAVRRAKAHKDIAQQIAAIRRPLVPALEDELSFVGVSFAADEHDARNVKQVLQTAVAELAATQREISEADAELRSAETRAKTERAAAVTELAALSRHWSSRSAVAPLRPLSPEQLGCNVLQALGLVAANRAAAVAELEKQKLTKKQPSSAAPSSAARPVTQPATSAYQVEWQTDLKLRAKLQQFVTLFGAGAGQPQRGFFATVDQALFFANGGQVRGWLAPSAGNLSDRLLKIGNSRLLAEELYLSVLTRRPSDEESAEIDRYLACRPKERSAAVQEAVWALLTSTEFRFNH